MKKFISAMVSTCILAMSMYMPCVQADEIKGTEIFYDDFSSSKMKSGWTINNATDGNVASIDTVNGNFVLEKSLNDNSSNVELTYMLDTPISSGRVDIEMTLMATSAGNSQIQIQFRGDNSTAKHHTMYRLIKDSAIDSRAEGTSPDYKSISNTVFSNTAALKFKSSINYDTNIDKNNITSYVNGVASSIKRGFITSTGVESNALKYIRIYIPKSTTTAGLVIDDFKITHYDAASNGNFEDFSGSLDSSKWSLVNLGNDGTNVAEVDAEEQNVRLHNAEGKEVGINYNLDSAVNEGKVAAEFTIRVNEKVGNQVQVMLRNAADQNLAFMRLQIGGIPELQNVEKDANGKDTYQTVGSTKLDAGVPVRIKLVVDYDATEGENVTVFANGTEVENKIGFKTADKGNALDDVFIKIAGAHNGVDVSIDDFNVYELGGAAEKIANTYNKLDLGNTMAVAENLNLITEDADNDTTISWKSDNEAVISSKGVLGGDKGTANLTATIAYGDKTISRNFIVKTFEYSYFENFDGENIPSGWSGESIDTVNKALLTSVKGDTRYTCDTSINSGKFAIEFDMSKQNEGEEFIQFKLQNSDKKDIALIDTAGGAVRVRDIIEGKPTYRSTVGAEVKTGEWVNVKMICDFTKDSEQVSIYLNGIKSNYDVSLFNEAIMDIKHANFYIPSAQMGAKYIIDNFKAYSLGGIAEETCLSSILGFDKTNVTKNITLPGAVEGGTVVWTSSDEAVITNSGVVTRPSDNDANVILTRVVTKDDITNKTDFRVTVPANNGIAEYIEGGIIDAEGMPSLLVADKAVKGFFKVNNDSDDAVTVTVITALYMGDELADVAVTPVTVPAGETDFVVNSNTIAIPSDATNYTEGGVAGEQNYEVASFLFTSMKDLIPLTNGILLK